MLLSRQLPLLQDMNARINHDMEKICKSIQNSKVLTIHGGADKTIPFADAHEFEKYINQHQLSVIEGASHNYDGQLYSKQMIALAVSFITSASA